MISRFGTEGGSSSSRAYCPLKPESSTFTNPTLPPIFFLFPYVGRENSRVDFSEFFLHSFLFTFFRFFFYLVSPLYFSKFFNTNFLTVSTTSCLMIVLTAFSYMSLDSNLKSHSLNHVFIKTLFKLINFSLFYSDHIVLLAVFKNKEKQGFTVLL